MSDQQPISETEARARLAIIRSVVNHRTPSVHTLAVVTRAAHGVPLIDLAVEQQIHEAGSGPTPWSIGGAA